LRKPLDNVFFADLISGVALFLSLWSIASKQKIEEGGNSGRKNHESARTHQSDRCGRRRV
jgi:hypothetical protein